MKMYQIAIALLCVIFVSSSHGAQDDVELILGHPSTKSIKSGGFDLFSDARSEIDLGYYLLADEYHQWRANVLGDLSLIKFSERLDWHMGLAMETLADKQNEMSFRLVQVYYHVLTGLNWELDSSSLLHLGYRHRCSHGTDRASDSRITIRSGITASYAHGWNTKHFQFDIKPGFNIYVVGQNNDLSSQPKGGTFLSAQALWPFMDRMSLILGSGLNIEVVSEGKNLVYLMWHSIDKWRIEPLFAARIALRFTRDVISTDFSLSFRQNLDSSIGQKAIKNNNLSLEMNFLW